MKTTSLKLQRIAAVVAIITAPMTALAVDGPLVSTWIPGAEIVETVAPLSTSLQPGPYNSRDTYKVFVTAVAGKDLRLVVTGSTGVKVDYFDEQRTNGLYAVFGAVDEGTMTLRFQSAPTGTTTWTTNETKVLTVGAKRTMNHDTEVPISAFWDCKAGITPPSEVSNPTPAGVEARLNTDFINMKADGFTCVQLIWKPSWDKAKATIYANLTQHGMKIRQELYAASAYVKANMNYTPTGNPWVWRHHDVKLLDLEAAVKTDMLADVGGGVALKDHPQLFAYYLIDECAYNFLRGNELTAMLAKNLDPFHGSGSSAGGLHGSATSLNIEQMAFADFLIVNSYPFANADTKFCEGCPATATSDFSKSNWQPGQYGYTPITNFMDWAQSFDPRRPLAVVNQAHEFPNGLRHPSPKELRALVMIAAAHGSRPFDYFIYGWFGTIYGFLEPVFVRTPHLDEARLVNQKLATWIPTYKDLKVSTIGSTPITYSYPARSPIVGNFTHKTTAGRYLIAVNTDCVNAKTVTINGVRNKANTGNATTARNVVSPFTVYNLTNGTLTIPSMAAGDGMLLQVDPPAGPTTLYSNNMEAAPTYTSGTLVTTPAPHGGLKSERRPADGVVYGSAALNLALPASVSNFTYRVWLTDNNHPTQTYRLFVQFRNPTTGAASPSTPVPSWLGAGTGWTQVIGDFTSIVNQRIGEGYTQLFKIYLQAWNGTTAPPYVPYYADDVLVTYQ